MFSAFRAGWIYLLTGLLAFVVFLAITAPLHFVWPYLQPVLGPLPVKVQGVSGTLWNGHLQLQQAMVGDLALDWRLQPASLLTLAPQLEVRVDSANLNLKGQLIVTADRHIRLRDLDAFVDSRLLQPLLKRQRTEIGGTFEAENLAIDLELDNNQPQLVSASGRLLYSGGNASFPVQRKTVAATVPMLVGELGMANGVLTVPVMTTAREAVSQLFLKPDGWGGIKVQRRLLDVTAQPWNGKEGPDAIIFEVSQKIL